MKENNYYVGIDLQEDFAMVGYFSENQTEPQTMSTIAGSEDYQIPLLLVKRTGIGQWLFGEEARKLAEVENTKVIDRLVERAKKRQVIEIEGENYEAVQLLGLFLKKLLLLPAKLGNPLIPEKLVLVREQVNQEEMQMFYDLLPQLGVSRDKFIVIDRKESFYYYLYHQKEELWLHDVVLFDYGKEKLNYYLATKARKTTPQLITIDGGTEEAFRGEKDTAFLAFIQWLFQKKIISSVYLVGDGFDGKWMQRSLAQLCRGRRVFMGKNLYAKGACYAAKVKDKKEDWQFVYIGDNEMKINVSLKVRKKGSPQFFTLISAGENWYEANCTCEVLLEGTHEIDFWLQLPESSEAKLEKLMLEDLPERPDGMTRLRIQAKPISDLEVKIKIWDLGFGEIWKSSEKTWEYCMKL